MGPAKSTAVYRNGGASLTRKGGSGGDWGAANGLPSKRLQMTHLCTTDLTSLLPPTIQYLARISIRVSLTPSGWTLWWASSAVSVNSRWVLGRMIRCLVANARFAFWSQPPHRHSPWPSQNNQKLGFPLSKHRLLAHDGLNCRDPKNLCLG